MAAYFYCYRSSTCFSPLCYGSCTNVHSSGSDRILLRQL